MQNRLKLHEELVILLGSRNVYFQPPESVKLCYPCIIYSLDNYDIRYADDKPYKNIPQYTVRIIDKNPDSILPEKLLGSFSMCRFDRAYTSDNLNHYIFSLYY